MNGKVAKEIRRFLKQDQDIDLSHKACSERGIRGVKLDLKATEYTELNADGELINKTIDFFQVLNPEKNYYRSLKKAYIRCKN